MRRFKRFSILILLLVQISASAKDTYFLITHGSVDPYWTSLFAGAKAAAELYKINIQILAPAGANDLPRQVQFIETALSTHPSGLAVTLPSNTAFSNLLKQAALNNIPVIAIDAKPEKSENNPYLAFIGSDNSEVGKVLAFKALNTPGEHQRAVILNPQPGHTGLEMRARGIKKVFLSKKLAIDTLEISADAIQIQNHLRAYLRQHPDTTDIFCLTSQALDPVGQMILNPQSHHLNKALNIYSFDRTPNTQLLLNKHLVKAIVDQQPYLIGYLAVTQLVLWNKQAIKPVSINTAT